jgi:hypothetical protein
MSYYKITFAWTTSTAKPSPYITGTFEGLVAKDKADARERMSKLLPGHKYVILSIIEM